MKSKVKILVATHKPDEVYHDDVYMPIHVGKALSNYNLGWQGDDTGDNISAKNPMYCELTAQYWAWKNLPDVEYVGLCHYRRYFETKITAENVDALLGTKYDVMLVEPIVERLSLERRLVYASCMEDVYIFRQCLVKLFPGYGATMDRFLHGNKFSPFNMFVMKKEWADEYCRWLFAILGEMEKYVRLSGYSRARRIYGYMGEVLLPMWCEHHGLKIRYEKVVPMLGEKARYSVRGFLRDTYMNMIFCMDRYRELDFSIASNWLKNVDKLDI